MSSPPLDQELLTKRESESSQGATEAMTSMKGEVAELVLWTPVLVPEPNESVWYAEASPSRP